MKKSMVTRIAAVAAGLAEAGSVFAVPAMAETKSGSITCGGGGKINVTGEQSKFDETLTLKADGKVLFSGSHVTTKTVQTNLTGTHTWSASSYLLVPSGSKATCRGILY